MDSTTQNVSLNIQKIVLALAISYLSLLCTNFAHATEMGKGSWVDKQYKVSGGWSIQNKSGQTVLTLDSKFKTKGGPDLKLFLSKHSIADANGKNATDKSILVSALKTNNGFQEYVLPEGISLNDFQSILIHCEKFSVLWGGANLR